MWDSCGIGCFLSFDKFLFNFLLELRKIRLFKAALKWHYEVLFKITFRCCFCVWCCAWDGSPSCIVLFGCILTQRAIRSGPIRWRRIGCAGTGWLTLRGQSSGRSFNPDGADWTGSLSHIGVCLEQGDMFFLLVVPFKLNLYSTHIWESLQNFFRFGCSKVAK